MFYPEVLEKIWTNCMFSTSFPEDCAVIK